MSRPHPCLYVVCSLSLHTVYFDLCYLVIYLPCILWADLLLLPLQPLYTLHSVTLYSLTRPPPSPSAASPYLALCYLVFSEQASSFSLSSLYIPCTVTLYSLSRPPPSPSAASIYLALCYLVFSEQTLHSVTLWSTYLVFSEQTSSFSLCILSMSLSRDRLLTSFCSSLDWEREIKRKYYGIIWFGKKVASSYREFCMIQLFNASLT